MPPPTRQRSFRNDFDEKDLIPYVRKAGAQLLLFYP